MANYTAKAVASFKTKFQLFTYNEVILRDHNILWENFETFKISNAIVSEYSSIYWQKELETIIRGKSIKKIQQLISTLNVKKDLKQSLRDNYVASFEQVFPRKKFEELIQNDYCHYCHITLSEIERLSNKNQLFKKSLRGWTLEIDRLNSNFEYNFENCVMSCYWCNNAKTDEFTQGEFEKIGLTIKEIWGERLSNGEIAPR